MPIAGRWSSGTPRRCPSLRKPICWGSVAAVCITSPSRHRRRKWRSSIALTSCIPRIPYDGSRKLTVVLSEEFGPINRKRVQRYMREMGIQGIAPGPNLSKRQTEHLGWLYLVAVLDWYRRYVLSWTLNETLELGFVLDAIAQARRVATPEI